MFHVYVYAYVCALCVVHVHVYVYAFVSVDVFVYRFCIPFFTTTWNEGITFILNQKQRTWWAPSAAGDKERSTAAARQREDRSGHGSLHNSLAEGARSPGPCTSTRAVFMFVFHFVFVCVWHVFMCMTMSIA